MRILILGVGGLGCEIAKNLTAENLGLDITLVDCDTIETSNLNRQLLFSSKDVGRFKAEVAKEWLEAHYRSKVKTICCELELLGSEFYASFNVIFSALDTVASRRWINEVVAGLAKNGVTVPLIDGGTEGYKGHCALIIPCYLACIECFEGLYSVDNVPYCTLAGNLQTTEDYATWAGKVVWPNIREEVAFDLKSEEHVNWLMGKIREKAVANNCDLEFDRKDVVAVLDSTIPSVSTTNSVIAALCVSFMKILLTKERIQANFENFLLFNGQDGVYLNRLCIGRDPNCKTCGQY